MAVGTPALEASGTAFFMGDDYELTTISVSVGDLVIIGFASIRGEDPPTMTGAGGSFTLLNTYRSNWGDNNSFCDVFYRIATNTGGAVEVDFGDGLATAWGVVVVAGGTFNASTPFVTGANAVARTTSDPLSISQPDRDSAGNMRIGFVCQDNGDPMSPTGSTELLESDQIFNQRLGIYYTASNTDFSISAVGGSGKIGVALEIAEAEEEGGQSVTPGTVDTGESVPSPQLNLAIAPGTTATGESVPSPALGLSLLPGTVDTGEAVPEPVLGLAIAPDTVASGEVVHEPVVSGDVVMIALDTVASGEEFFAPQLNLSLATDATDSSESVPQPTIVPGVVDIETSFLETSEAVYDAALGFTLQPGTVSTGEELYPISIQGFSVLAGTVETGESVPQPTLGLRVAPGTIATAAEVFSPFLGHTLQVFAGTAAAFNFVHNPTLTRVAAPFEWGKPEVVSGYPMGPTTVTRDGAGLNY